MQVVFRWPFLLNGFECVRPAGTYTTAALSFTEATAAERLRAYLMEVAARGVPFTYAEAARVIGLEPPFSIHRITEAIEQLMAEDAAAGRPSIY